MGKLKHTPGPWEKRSIPKCKRAIYRKDKKGLCISLVLGDNLKEQADANARLIVAAPEMIEALIKIYMHSDLYPIDSDYVINLIEKATGMSIEEVLDER